MSVPLDRLYNYLQDVVNHDVVIYRWMPHGSRKLEDVCMIKNYTWEQWIACPSVICHDQEPLSLYHWQAQTFEHFQNMVKDRTTWEHQNYKICSELFCDQIQYHLDHCGQSACSCFSIWPIDLKLNVGLGVYDSVIITHSELNSQQVTMYEQSGFVPVYVWSHALIAQDWFRYAQLDPQLNHSSVSHDFLIYNRAWGGTREYRLRFVQELLRNKLESHCLTSFNCHDNDVYYTQHQWHNQSLKIVDYDFEHRLPANTHSSLASADYHAQDYCSTGVEIVLETLFDDQRWHLTEKTLRPIACGHPFILMATAGSLEYLRSYGFETFDGLIDESYDTIQDPLRRLQAVISEMKRISQLSTSAKQLLWSQLREIAKKNKQRFFSKKFHNQVINEYRQNFDHAMVVMEQHKNGKRWRNDRRWYQTHLPNVFEKYREYFDQESKLLGLD